MYGDGGVVMLSTTISVCVWFALVLAGGLVVQAMEDRWP
jgi:hypothetical protein